MKRIIIAIDGHSACGKSTLAKGLAKILHYAYLDSGAMYRAVTLYFLENQSDYNDPPAVEEALQRIEIHFERIEGQNRTFSACLYPEKQWHPVKPFLQCFQQDYRH